MPYLSPSWGTGHTACPTPPRINNSTLCKWFAFQQEAGYKQNHHSDVASKDPGRHPFLQFVLKQKAEKRDQYDACTVLKEKSVQPTMFKTYIARAPFS